MTEFINLRQCGKSVHEYSLEFIKLSNYAPFLVSDPRDQMSHFVMGVSEDLQEECRSAMLLRNMNISCLMVYVKRVKKARSKRKSRDSKRERSFDGGSSKNMLEIQVKPRFRSGFLIKSIPISQDLVVIPCLNLNSRREKVLIN